MKYLRISALLILVLLMSVTVMAEKGPVVDKVYWDVRMQQEIGIKDVAEGKSDIFYYGVDYPIIAGLDQETLDKLEIYSAPSGSWSININTYPNEAPYTLTLEGKEYFNPFAMREIRFALNFLINRQYIVDEILGGGGGVMFTFATPGQPGTYKYNLVAGKFGFTPQGDEEKALTDIEAAMNKAAALPQNQGRLVRNGEWWTFDGEPVSIKFLIRVDDPGRTREGEYIANQIEKAGIKVERLMWERSKCSQTTYVSKPEDYLWNLYTEGWGAGATRAWWHHIVAQMYASWYLPYLPGGFADGWKHEPERINELTQTLMKGNFLTTDDYWDMALEATELGLEDAVRLYVCYQNTYFVANKDRFNSRFAYGLGDGLNKWTLYTSDTTDGILRATQFSSQGSLFMSPWDPVGMDGFGDVYSNYILGAVVDDATFESPGSAIDTPNRVVPLLDTLETRVHMEGEELVGEIDVPAECVEYDPAAEEWVSIGEGKKSFSRCEYDLRLGNSHHGKPMTVVDFMYADAFLEEWASKDSEDDPYFDEGIQSSHEGTKIGVGTIYDLENEKIINYYDYNFPASRIRAASSGAPSWRASIDDQAGVVWEIVEAMARMVAHGSASGEIYVFNDTTEGALDVDVIRPSCVADIRAELEEMAAEKHVPAGIKDYLSPEEAVERYQACIDFIDKYGHAFIANGAFFISRIEPETNFIELSAFRDESYPYEAGYWVEELKTTVLSVDNVGLPSMAARGEKIVADIYVSDIIYPVNTSSPAEEGNVKLLLIAGDEEIEFKADPVIPGYFLAEIPGEVTAELEPGSYTILAIAEAEGAVPSTSTNTVILY